MAPLTSSTQRMPPQISPSMDRSLYRVINKLPDTVYPTHHFSSCGPFQSTQAMPGKYSSPAKLPVNKFFRPPPPGTYLNIPQDDDILPPPPASRYPRRTRNPPQPVYTYPLKSGTDFLPVCNESIN